MSQNAIRTLLETRLMEISAGAWSATTGWDNKAAKRKAEVNEPYQVVSLLPAQPDTFTLGETTHDEQGIFQVLLYYPRGETAKGAETRAEAIQAHFYAGLSLTNGTIKVRVRGKPAIASGFDGPDRYMVPVSIRYRSITK